MKIIIRTLVIWFLFLPIISEASVMITEIMYDLEGTDGGYEWFEILNIGNESVDLVSLKLYENSVNHSIKSEANSVLEVGQYAIIADNIEKFKEKNSFAGIIVDSAFSLNNNGETIEIRDADLTILDSVTYSKDMGANGTGGSLQWQPGGNWIASTPTPGMSNNSDPEQGDLTDETGDQGGDGNDDEDSSTNSASNSGTNKSAEKISSHDSFVELSTKKPKQTVSVYAGRDRLGFVNTPLLFSVGKPEKGLKYIWSFGDGTSREGAEVEHIYSQSGNYNVVLNARDGDNRAVSRSKITINNPDLEIIDVVLGKKGYITLKNKGNTEVNIGGWEIESELNGTSDGLIISRDTIVSSGESVTFSLKNFFMPYFFEKASLIDPEGEIKSTVSIIPDGILKKSDYAEISAILNTI